MSCLVLSWRSIAGTAIAEALRLHGVNEEIGLLEHPCIAVLAHLEMIRDAIMPTVSSNEMSLYKQR